MKKIKDSRLRDLINKNSENFSDEVFRCAFVLTNICEEAFDLLKKLLVLDPHERLSAEEALKHPFFKELHEKNDKN